MFDDDERTTDGRERSTARNRGDTTGRRGVLRAAGAAVGGVGVFGAVSGTVTAGDKGADNADAPQDFPRVTTRDHFDEDANLINGQTEWSYATDGHWPFWGEEELTLFVHGWRSSDEEDEDIDAGYECRLALEAAGYTGSTAVFSWDSDKGDSLDGGWSDAKAIAKRNGRKLANFVQWYTNEYGVGARLIAHSLGARVTIYALQSLDDDYGLGNALRSVTFVGGALEKDSVAWDAGWGDEEFGDHIASATEQFDNFHSYDDDILENIFFVRETEEAVGEVGAQYTPPSNYTDFDVTSEIGEAHRNYYKKDEGIVDQIVAQF